MTDFSWRCSWLKRLSVNNRNVSSEALWLLAVEFFRLGLRWLVIVWPIFALFWPESCTLWSEDNLIRSDRICSDQNWVGLNCIWLVKMGEGKASIIIMIFVFVVDVIAFGLAVAAEQRRSTVSSCPFSSNFVFVQCDTHFVEKSYDNFRLW